jgi:hypothetical protein
MTQTATIPLDAELARDSLAYLTVARVVNYLTYTFDAGTDEILDLSDTRRRWATTPLGYAQDNADKAGALACDAPVVFWGGPPGNDDWYTGTLLDMLIDRVFYNVAIGNNVVVQRFLENCR